MFPINRLMEKKILSTINRIVNILIELSYLGESDKSSHYDEAITLIQEIHPLLLRLVDGKSELLESLIKQLISQKMPHPSILSSFGSLQKDLNIIISRALCAKQTLEDEDALAEQFPETEEEIQEPSDDITEEIQAPAVDDITEEEFSEVSMEPEIIESALPLESLDSIPQEKSAADNLQGIIDIIYANEKVIKNYFFRSLKLDYYLPERKLGILTIEPSLRKPSLYDFLLRKEGLSLVEIYPGEESNIMLLSRKLPRFS